MKSAAESVNPSAEETFHALQAQLAVLEDLSQSQSLLSWDQNTYMPAGAAAARGQQMATLSKLSHERLIDPQLGEMLSTLEPADFADESDEAALLEVTRRNVDKATKLPSDFVEDFTKARAAGQQAWIKARSDSDFAQFAPHLETILDFARRQADYSRL